MKLNNIYYKKVIRRKRLKLKVDDGISNASSINVKNGLKFREKDDVPHSQSLPDIAHFYLYLYILEKFQIAILKSTILILKISFV